MPSFSPNGIFGRILERKTAFFSVFFLMFLLSYGFLYAIDFIPEKPASEKPAETVQVKKDTPVPHIVDPYPKRMIIEALGKDIVIQNPMSRSIKDLDTALLAGAVRHPDSADFMHEGNIFLFGHSSYLPHVFNKNFQAFNEIQKLVWGDEILLQSGDMEYRYRVTKVFKTKASEAEVTFDNGRARLTLVTCNSFGTKDDRFVVEAELIGRAALGSNSSGAASEGRPALDGPFAED